MVRRCNCSAATGRSGRITCTFVESKQDPDWPVLNLIWLDILYPGIKSVRPSVQNFSLSCELCNRHLFLAPIAFLSFDSITNLCTPWTSPNKTKRKHYALNRALHSSSYNTWWCFLPQAGPPAINNKTLIIYAPPVAVHTFATRSAKPLIILLFLHVISFSVIVFSLTVTIGLSGLKTDMGRSVGFGRPQPQVALLPPPVPHDAPPTRMTSDFESLVRVYVMMLYDQPAAPRTAFFQGLITWRNTYASCRWLFSFTRRWPRPTVRTCFWMHRHRTPNQRAICPHNSIWKSVAGEFCTEVHINTSWISSRRERTARQNSIQMGNLKWASLLLLQGALRTAACGYPFTPSRIGLTKRVKAKPKDEMTTRPYARNFQEFKMTCSYIGPHIPWSVYKYFLSLLNRPCSCKQKKSMLPS